MTTLANRSHRVVEFIVEHKIPPTRVGVGVIPGVILALLVSAFSIRMPPIPNADLSFS